MKYLQTQLQNKKIKREREYQTTENHRIYSYNGWQIFHFKNKALYITQNVF